MMSIAQQNAVMGDFFCRCKINGHPHLSNEICWEKSINENSINGITMHAKRAHYGTFRKKCFILYVHILHINSLVSIDTSV